jgi:hypothetical protein
MVCFGGLFSSISKKIHFAEHIVFSLAWGIVSSTCLVNVNGVEQEFELPS